VLHALLGGFGVAECRADVQFALLHDLPDGLEKNGVQHDEQHEEVCELVEECTVYVDHVRWPLEGKEKRPFDPLKQGKS
jgi:hypothetical protein